jgi:predicted RNA binding protein YcfA (HicA-like mRNA interferase family)
VSKHKITPVPWNELVKKLAKAGFEGPYQGGKHPYMIKGELVLTIPNPHPEDISVDLIMRIIRQAGIVREEWLND